MIINVIKTSLVTLMFLYKISFKKKDIEVNT